MVPSVPAEHEFIEIGLDMSRLIVQAVTRNWQ